MGKTTRWLKRFVAKLRSDSTPKGKRSLVKSYTDKSSSIPGVRRAGDATSSSSSASVERLQAPAVEVPEYGADDARKHAVAVAEASAAAAQAALAAAQAAAAVVRLTASGRHYATPAARVSLGGARETWAALVIQSHFRGYLARRALRALKGLVKLQALVRGHIMRKKTAETMRSIEAMLRAQARARSLRAYDSPLSSDKSPQFYHPGPPTPEKLEQTTSYSKTASNTQSPMSKGPLTPEKLERTSYSKITSNAQSPMSKGSGSRSIISRVIIHPDKGYINSPAWSESQFDELNPQHRTDASCSTEEDYYVQTDKILEIDMGKNLNQSIQHEEEEEEEIAFCTAENSPHFYSASLRRKSPMTPTKSDTSAASCPSGYSYCPRSYMAYTESSRAKMRSLSAPRQRPQQCNERAGLKKGPSLHQKVVSSASISLASFASKAYAGSGRLDGLGMPVRNNSKRFAIVDV